MASEPVPFVMAPNNPIRRASSSAWAIVFLCMAIAGISQFNRFSIKTAANARIMDQYGIDPTAMGWVYSALLLAYTACMIPGGWVIDRFGARAALALVGFGSSVFVALTGCIGFLGGGTAFVFGALLVVRSLMGVVTAPLHPACARMVGHWVPPGGRARANGLVTGAALAGIAATPPVFGALIDRLDWPLAFLVTSAATIAVSILWIAHASDRPDAPPPQPIAPDAITIDNGNESETMIVNDRPISDWMGLLRDRSLVLLTLGYGTVSYFQYLFFYWMDYYFEKVLHLPEQTSRFYAMVPSLAMAVGMPLGGWISDRVERAVGLPWGRRIVPMAGLFGGAVFLGCGLLTVDPNWSVTWFALALASVGAVEGPFWASAVELGGTRGGSAAALLNTGGNGAGLIAPIVTPWVGALFGWSAAVALGGGVCLVGVVLWLGIRIEPPSCNV